MKPTVKNKPEKTLLKTAQAVSNKAVQALLYEVSITPKPGLVDRNNTGAHQDMDMVTFINSAIALDPYFTEVTWLGAQHQGDLSGMLVCLRPAGLLAEKTMLAATGGANTHKGLIFSLGVLCAAVGFLHAQNKPLSLTAILDTCAAICAGTPGELVNGATASATHGQRAYQAYGLTGARGEAAAGFPNVKRHGYPVFAASMAKGAGLNNAGVETLLHLLAHVDDTNIVTRANEKALRQIQSKAKSFLHTKPGADAIAARALVWDKAFIGANISPGGSADLLALSIMLYLLLGYQ